MKIAILGWGSLIWNPKDLKHDNETGWNENGPLLPIEFSRISNDGRLTLVIDRNATPIQTLYTQSAYSKLDEAILNLAHREGCTKNSIGHLIKKEPHVYPENFVFKTNIVDWIKNTDFDAVIWTNLSVKFKNKIGLDYNIDNVLKYLETLPEETKVLAEYYIRNTPNQIQTATRKAIEDRLNWSFIDNNL